MTDDQYHTLVNLSSPIIKLPLPLLLMHLITFMLIQQVKLVYYLLLIPIGCWIVELQTIYHLHWTVLSNIVILLAQIIA